MLLGEEALQRLREAVVVVAGLGGVGAYAAEMTARAGVGRMVLIDSDRVGESNKNRQLLAMNSTLGRLKTEVMAERLLDINPALQLVTVAEYLTEDNVPAILEGALEKMSPDFLIDAIDTLAPKIALISHCVHNGIPLVSSMGAGAKLDATKVRLTDLSKSYNCPLAFILRKKLRKIGITKGFPVVFSEELPERDAIVPTEGRTQQEVPGRDYLIPAGSIRMRLCSGCSQAYYRSIKVLKALTATAPNRGIYCRCGMKPNRTSSQPDISSCPPGIPDTFCRRGPSVPSPVPPP